MSFGRIARGSAEDSRTEKKDLQAPDTLGPEGLFWGLQDFVWMRGSEVAASGAARLRWSHA